MVTYDGKSQPPPLSNRPLNPSATAVPPVPPLQKLPQPQTYSRKPHESGSWGWIVFVVLAIGGGLGWWWYERRAREDVVADIVSASASGEGELLVDAKPWGRIEEVLNTASNSTVPLSAGSPFTPRVAVLPVGSYEVTVSHLGGSTGSCRVDVVEGKRLTCEVRIFEADPRAYFKEYGW